MITSPSAPVMANSQDQAEVTKLSDDLVSQINNTSTAAIFQPLAGVQNGDSIYTLPLGLAWYKCYIPSAYLVSTDSSGHALTIRTSASGSKVVKVPLAPSTDTILSGNLFFDVLVDSAGNVTASSFEIGASNTNGNYTKKQTGMGTGILICWGSIVSPSANANTSFVLPARFKYASTFGLSDGIAASCSAIPVLSNIGATIVWFSSGNGAYYVSYSQPLYWLITGFYTE